jgi:hypothetical protein
MFLKLLNGSPITQITEAKSLSLNFFQTLVDTILGTNKTSRVELALQRAHLYSALGKHEESLEDFHFVVENRAHLAPHHLEDPGFL